jgi:hypothetical protein
VAVDIATEIDVIKILIGLLAASVIAPALCAPMGFKDSWMAMGDFGPNWSEAFANYALTPRDAIGVSLTRMRSDDKARTRELYEATYTRLIQRWNMPEAQANIWFIGGLGSTRGNDFSSTKTMLSPGVQLDYETTRFYVSALGRLYRAGQLNHDYAAARIGFSFYEVDYEETQPWLVLEVRRMRGLSDKAEFTPMLRIINRSYFVELGINNSSQIRANFMYIF